MDALWDTAFLKDKVRYIIVRIVIIIRPGRYLSYQTKIT